MPLSPRYSHLTMILATVLIMASGCQRGQYPLDDEDMVPHSLQMDDVRLEIHLPEYVEKQVVAESSQVQFRFNSMHSRYHRSITFFSPPIAPDPSPLTHTITLENGAELSYRTDQPESIGSGGPEVHLTGIITFEHSLTLGLICHIQSEWAPEADWCLPFLHQLTIS